MPCELLGDVAARKRRNSGQEKVERAAERVHITLNAGRPAVSRLLGSHVIHRPDRRSLPRDSLILVFSLQGQAQIDHLDLPCQGPQDVRRLDVAMNQSLGRRRT